MHLSDIQNLKPQGFKAFDVRLGIKLIVCICGSRENFKIYISSSAYSCFSPLGLPSSFTSFRDLHSYNMTASTGDESFAPETG